MTTMIKIVAEVVSTYIVSSFLIPKDVCNKLHRVMCDFWWGDMCKSKQEGGLGFRNLTDFNEIVLVKQRWRLIINIVVNLEVWGLTFKALKV